MNTRPLFFAGILLGLGLGGFFDGIVFHQILGWHHLVCTTESCQPTSIAHLQQQNTQDGWFHVATWILVLTGVVALFRAGRLKLERWSGRELTGGMLAGAGGFNFFEGMINHQILGIHHVRAGHPQEFLFDMLFLGSGIVGLLAGWYMGLRTPEFFGRHRVPYSS